MTPAFRIWLHPRRAAREAEELESLLSEARAEAEKALAAEACARGMLAAADEMKETLLKRCADLERFNAELQNELEEARGDLEALDEIEEAVGRMEKSRDRYRERIASLKMELGEARRQLGLLKGKSVPPKQLTINMLSSGNPEAQAEGSGPSGETAASEADTPEQPHGKRRPGGGKRGRQSAETPPGGEGSGSGRESDSDWLLSLPDSL